VRPANSAENLQHINVSPFWFTVAVLGVVANFAVGWVWLGLGPALFITGALTAVLSWASVALFLSTVLRWSAAMKPRKGERR
jgi:hypothetical protein